MKSKILYCFISLISVIILLCGVNVYFKHFSKYRNLSHDELINYINKYCTNNTGENYKIELEKDIDNTHILVLSYNDVSSSNKLISLAAFTKTKDDKYKYCLFKTCIGNICNIALSTNNNKKNYAVLFGNISNNQPNKFLVRANGKSFEDVFERNKFFIKAYEMNSSNSVSISTMVK